MGDYRIRNATRDDFSFIADTIIGAEKGNSGKLSFATIFELEEKDVKDLIIGMLEENIDGCEFSPSSYLIADYKDIPVAAVASWIECYNGILSSTILKSNLLSFFLEEKQIQSLKLKSQIICDLIIEREAMTLQFEYLYVTKAHRGRGLHERLMNEHLVNAFSVCPELIKAQLRVYENNYVAIRLYEQNGFRKVRSYTSDNNEILDYLPYNTKILMEKDLTHMAF